MARNAVLLVCALAAVGLVAGCGGGSSGPEIVKFSGPDIVPCGKSGEVKTVAFQYETKNATAVEPEIDGQPPGAQAGYDPNSGTMSFAYICPGPHTMTITASGKGGKTVSKSAQIEPSSSG
ncbi:MAG TPA: hypothetical protein VF895_04745 [Gaiellaceae bacterium]